MHARKRTQVVVERGVHEQAGTPLITTPDNQRVLYIPSLGTIG